MAQFSANSANSATGKTPELREKSPPQVRKTINCVKSGDQDALRLSFSRPVFVGRDLMLEDSHQRDRHTTHQIESLHKIRMYLGAEDSGAMRLSEMSLQFVCRSGRNSHEAKKLSPARFRASFCEIRRDGIRSTHSLTAQPGDTPDRWRRQCFDDLHAQILREVPYPEFLRILHAAAYRRGGPHLSSFERKANRANAAQR